MAGRRSREQPQRGTALLLAMVILTLVATTAAGMVWQQRRAVQIEAAERARSQAAWVLLGALDWARLVLREDQRAGAVDHLGEPWAVPLAEARLSTFLAADADPTAADGPEAFLSGRIADLQSHFNAANLIDDEDKVVPAELAVLQRLCELAGAPADTADRIAKGLAGAETEGATDAPLTPQRFEHLAWLGIEPTTLERLAPFVTLLPARTPVNLNTAPREVIAAVIDGLDPGTAERLVQRRLRQPFGSVAEVQRELPQGLTMTDGRVAVSTRFFEVVGRLRLDERVLEQRSLVERRGAAQGGEVVALWRERRAASTPNP
ncbi:MAG: type II secretion system minor pseudopilin GspK [Rubrivivax sp.]